MLGGAFDVGAGECFATGGRMNANLRLQDLYGREKEGETKLLALYVPKELTTRIDRLAKDLKAKKREVILALLNEGLDRYHRSKGRRRTPKKS
jgi:hypothetical protein